MTPLVIIGAGGFGREVLDIVEAVNASGPMFDFLGFVDDDESLDLELLRGRGAPFLGAVEALASIDASYVIGIGSPSTRRLVDVKVSAWGRSAVSIAHPGSTVASQVAFGPGAIVAAGARLTTNIRIGRHFHANLNATVGHDCTLGDYVTLNPGANISGGVTLGHGVMIGTGAAVIQGRTVGDWALIGAGAVVVRDVEPGVTAVGVPARRVVERPT